MASLSIFASKQREVHNASFSFNKQIPEYFMISPHCHCNLRKKTINDSVCFEFVLLQFIPISRHLLHVIRPSNNTVWSSVESLLTFTLKTLRHTDRKSLIAAISDLRRKEHCLLKRTDVDLFRLWFRGMPGCPISRESIAFKLQTWWCCARFPAF